MWWTNGYQNWNDEDFKYRLLASVGPYMSKIPTNFVPHPIENYRQIALTIYRLAHGCSFSTLSDLFADISKVRCDLAESMRVGAASFSFLALLFDEQ